MLGKVGVVALGAIATIGRSELGKRYFAPVGDDIAGRRLHSRVAGRGLAPYSAVDLTGSGVADVESGVVAEAPQPHGVRAGCHCLRPDRIGSP
jgi:hypothetical protein